MSEIQELISSTDRLCSTFDQLLLNEKKFCHELALELERMSWETMRMRNDMTYLKERFSDYRTNG